MAIDRRFIGFVSAPRSTQIDRGMLRLFAKATGESNPVYFDDAAAVAAGYPGIPAPPTYAIVLFSGAPAVGSSLEDLGVDERDVLHGEQSYRHHRMMFAGDQITLTTTTSDIYARKGGALEFIVYDTTAVNQHGQLCTEMRSVLVVRHGALPA